MNIDPEALKILIIAFVLGGIVGYTIGMVQSALSIIPKIFIKIDRMQQER